MGMSSWIICLLLYSTLVFTSTRWYEQDLRVFVGSNRLSEQTQYEIASYKVHESYDVQGKNNDIAIVKTAQPIQMVDNAVRAVTLSNADPSQGTQAGMIGWGSPTEDPGNFKNELQELIGEVQDRNDCDPDGFTETVTDKQICTMQNGLGQGACRGDNGGPLLVDGEQVGIISFFKTTIYDGECGNGLPVVHTLVGAYADWIEQNRNF